MSIGRFQGETLLDHPPSKLIETHEERIQQIVNDIVILKQRLRREREYLKAIKAARERRLRRVG